MIELLMHWPNGLCRPVAIHNIESHLHPSHLTLFAVQLQNYDKLQYCLQLVGLVLRLVNEYYQASSSC